MASGPSTPSYHHGNLRAALLGAAADAAARGGASAVNLRELARQVGVSHAAASHHFGDKAGLVTALGAEGFLRLAERLQTAWDRSGVFADVGVAYVSFAVDHPGHFEVMFRTDLQRQDDESLHDAKAAAAGVLFGSAESVSDAAGGDTRRAAIAGWSLVHGLAELWRGGNIPPPLGTDPVVLAESLVGLLFQAMPPGPRPKSA
jgi:AcrR family transcriptional regulator